jgi:hypothetical protein
MYSGIVFNKSSSGLSAPEKIFFSEGSIISNEGLISLELDNFFHLYESKGKSLVFDINSKKRTFYGDLKLDNSIDFVLDNSNYSVESLVNRGILKSSSLFDAFSNLNILNLFINSINSLTHDKISNHSGLNILDFLKVSGLNAPLKYEFSNIISDKYYILTEYGSKHIYMELNKLNSYSVRTLHKIAVSE